MAVIHTGSIVSDIRGSVGTETYSRNQGGLYVRERKGPSGEPTAKQITATDAMTLLSQYWSNSLTQAKRDAWQQYAAQYPSPNRWGQPLLTNGYTRFIATNFTETQRTHAVFTTNPPTAPPIGPPAFTFRAQAGIARYNIPVPVMPETPPDQIHYAYVYEGTVVGPGGSFYQPPFAYIWVQAKTYTNWTATPLSPTTALPLVAGQKVFLRLRIQNRVTCALSSPAYASTIIEA